MDSLGLEHCERAAGRQEDRGSILTALASFASQACLDSIPEAVRGQARGCLLDTIGCIAAGATDPEAQRLLAVESESGGQAQSSVLGSPTRLPMQGAARVNGYMGDVLELNDLFGGHASIACIPAALAVGQARAASGPQLLEAIIVAIETTARIYKAFYPALKPYTSVGMNPAGIPSTMGSAAGVARLMNLDPAATLHAMAIAGSLAGWCPAEVIFGRGGTVKPLLFGAWPASVAIQAAQYAEAGFDGPVRLLESPLGYYATAASQFDRAAATEPAGWYLLEPSRKLHACCSYIHSAIETLAALRKEGWLGEASGTVRVRMAPYVMEGVSKSGRPASPNEARFHSQYLLALAAIEADVILPEHSEQVAAHLANPRVLAMMDRIQVQADPRHTHYYQCSVELLDRDGREVMCRIGAAPKGSPKNPMVPSELRAKFDRLASPRFTGKDIAVYMNRIESIEHHAEWSWLFDEFC